MTLPYLGFLGNAPPHDLEIVRVLSPAEYEEYEEKANLLVGFFSDYLRFEMVRESYAEYRRSLRYYEREYAVRPRFNDVTPDQVTHDLNRRLRGFFTEFRSFLDFAERKLKRQYGSDSPQAQEWKQATRTHFDGSLAYRFMYQLRNYGQHVDLPISVLSLSAERPLVPAPETQYHLEVQVDRDELLDSGFHWRPQDVRPWLRSLPPKFGLNGYVEEMMACLEQLNVSFVCARLPDAKRCARYVASFIKPCVGQGRPCIFGQELESPTPADAESTYMLATNVHWVPVELVAWVSQLPEPDVLSRYAALDVDFRFRDHE